MSVYTHRKKCLFETCLFVCVLAENQIVTVDICIYVYIYVHIYILAYACIYVTSGLFTYKIVWKN